MRLLAVETATIEVGAALVEDGHLVATATARPGRRHVETLHPAIEAVLAQAGVGLGDLGGIGVDVGPGLFTGLRVGIAAAKGLALGLGLPVVACTSLEVLHRAAASITGPVAAVVDMRRGELAWSIRPGPGPGPGPDSGPSRGPGPGPVVLGTPGDLVAALEGLEAPATLVGDGARRHGEALGANPRIRLAGDELGAPPVASLALLAAERLAAGEGQDPARVEACYLRPVDARINWTTRDGPPAVAAAAEA